MATYRTKVLPLCNPSLHAGCNKVCQEQLCSSPPASYCHTGVCVGSITAFADLDGCVHVYGDVAVSEVGAWSLEVVHGSLTITGGGVLSFTGS
jgi:hypothetical protein